MWSAANRCGCISIRPEGLTASDVTLSTGIMKYCNISWSITDDDRKTAHENIMLEIGCKECNFTKEVTYWRVFDWTS